MDEFAGDLSRGDQIKRYTDYREMCRDPEIDAIFVGTPNQLHVPGWPWKRSAETNT